MSDTRINIRLFAWHLKVTFGWKFSVSYNAYHKDKNYPDGVFEVYQFEPFRKF